MYQLFVSFRYLKSRLISNLCLAGLAIGVATLVVVNSVMSGFTKEFHRRLRGTQAHLTVEAEEHLGIADAGLLERILQSTEVVLGRPRSEAARAFVLDWTFRNGLALDPRTLEPSPRPKFCGRLVGEDAGSVRLVNPEGETLAIRREWIEEVRPSPVRGTLPYLEALVLVSTAWRKDAGKLRAQDPVAASRVANFAPSLQSPSETYAEAYGRFFSRETFALRYSSSRLLYSLWRQGSIDLAQLKSLVQRSRARDGEWGLGDQRLGNIGVILIEEGFNPSDLSQAVESDVTGFEALSDPAAFPDVDPHALLDQTRSGLPGLVVGLDLFRGLELLLGEVVTLTTVRKRPDGEFESLEQEFEVVATYKSGFADTDARALFCSLPAMQFFLAAEGDVRSGIDLMVESADEAAAAKPGLETRLSSHEQTRDALRIATWEEKNRTLIQAVAMEKWALSLILLFMMCVAGLILLVILLMMVNERLRDVGIMKALGATTQGVLGTFLIQGFFIGVSGAAVGLVLGLVAAWNVNEIADFVELLVGWHPFPRDVYALDAIPVDVRISDILFIVCPMVFTSLVLSIYPAYLASRMDPTRALQARA